MDMNNGYGGQASKFTFDHNYAYDSNEGDAHLDGSKAGKINRIRLESYQKSIILESS